MSLNIRPREAFRGRRPKFFGIALAPFTFEQTLTAVRCMEAAMLRTVDETASNRRSQGKPWTTLKLRK
jgi:hypothetical protein